MRFIPCEHLADTFGPNAPFPYSIALGETACVEVADCYGGFPGKGRPGEGLRPNPVTGPIAIAGIQPGETIAVDIHAVEPVADGFIGLQDFTWMTIDREAGKIHHPAGFELPLRPCIGTIGVACASAEVETIYAGDHGGNMDANIIGEGTRVCFRAQVPEAGLGMGDVHAVQGDGELSGQGLECAARITFAAHRVPGLPIPHPYGLREGWFFVVGWGRSIADAMQMAQRDMVAAVTAVADVDEDTAFRLQGLVMNLRAGWATGPVRTVWIEFAVAILPPDARGRLFAALGLPAQA